MTSAPREGGGVEDSGNANEEREVAWFYPLLPGADKGEGVQKSENFAGVIHGCPQVWWPTDAAPAAPLQSSQEWSPKARIKDCLVGGDGNGNDDSDQLIIRVRVDLFSAHVLSEFVVDMTPATNAAAEAAAKAAGKEYSQSHVEERERSIPQK